MGEVLEPNRVLNLRSAREEGFLPLFLGPSQLVAPVCVKRAPGPGHNGVFPLPFWLVLWFRVVDQGRRAVNGVGVLFVGFAGFRLYPLERSGWSIVPIYLTATVVLVLLRVPIFFYKVVEVPLKCSLLAFLSALLLTLELSLSFRGSPSRHGRRGIVDWDLFEGFGYVRELSKGHGLVRRSRVLIRSKVVVEIRFLGVELSIRQWNCSCRLLVKGAR